MIGTQVSYLWLFSLATLQLYRHLINYPMKPHPWRTYINTVIWQGFGFRAVKGILGLFMVDLSILLVGDIFSHVVLTDVERDGDVVRFYLLWIKRPLQIKRECLELPLQRIHKIEYLDRRADGRTQFHLLVKQSRTPSRYYTIRPYLELYVMAEEINEIVWRR